MFPIVGLILLLSACLLLLLLRHLSLKTQIRSLASQMLRLSGGETQKLLDISFIDRDLEHLAAILNRNLALQRNAVARAFRHEEHLKESVANISHDLRTPLTVILGHLQLLKKSPLTAEQAQRVDISLQKALRLEEFISLFYELSLADSKKIQPVKQRLNFSNLLMDLLTGHAAFFSARQITPQISLPDVSVFVLAEKTVMERILQNLLTNSIRYSYGEIRISLKLTAERTVLFEVENTLAPGHTMDPVRIFDRFYTGVHSPANGSTGLGLSIVKLLTEQSGGSVSASLDASALCIRLTFPSA